ncbi:hypothetical protein PBI_PIPEFISH_72 [Mycobacterium phage Pipefish]|uniref:Uncharacterized protein n=1 Tax=Mycobacterium phage Pipefish TaxID=373413 RepID=Q19YT3_9CAUD|nr:gp72 [Mycobacterium phage Pipefish]ABD58569.1 hypothetical protein PBI_PIPEFISH_72 [Mycobacterium phage Pipefish]
MIDIDAARASLPPLVAAGPENDARRAVHTPHVEMPEIVREALASGKQWNLLTPEQQEAGLAWMRNQRGANFWKAQA